MTGKLSNWLPKVDENNLDKSYPKSVSSHPKCQLLGGKTKGFWEKQQKGAARETFCRMQVPGVRGS